jgi:hypothetical protein
MPWVRARQNDARPDLDSWLPRPVVRVSHRRESTASPEALWHAAQEVSLRDARLLGRLVRWRIPGTSAEATFDELFRRAPFAVLEERALSLLSGIVGRIWTLRRDYPVLASAVEFRQWSQPGTARVLFANWVEESAAGGSLLRSETRVEPFGVQGRIGVASVRPLIRGFQQLIGTDAMGVAVGRAEAGP